jgi:RecB family exonuclease
LVAQKLLQTVSKRRMQPPYDAREDEVLLKQLPIQCGMRAAVARELAGKGELMRRNATSIAQRLPYHEVVAESGGGVIAKTLGEALQRLETQRAALQGLANGIERSAFHFEERAPTGAFMGCDELLSWSGGMPSTPPCPGSWP